MGYLDKSAVTVDAILTKQGRKLLAQGQGLNITHFSLHDNGVDYTTWNPDHPSGSAYYGEAIEGTPQPEALPSAEYLYKNRLVSYERGTTRLPVINTGALDSSYTFIYDEPFTLTVQTLGNPSITEQYAIIVYEASILQITSHSPQSISGVDTMFVNQLQIPYAQLYTGNAPFTIQAVSDGTERTVGITIIGQTTGANATRYFTVPPNLQESTVQ